MCGHVIVGYNVAIGGDEEAGTFADDHTLRLLAVGKKNLKDHQMRDAPITTKSTPSDAWDQSCALKPSSTWGDIGAPPRSLYWNELRIDIIDQWYGADYRYVKVKDDDGGLYILRFDERRNEWALIMFVSARGQVLATQTA